MSLASLQPLSVDSYEVLGALLTKNWMLGPLCIEPTELSQLLGGVGAIRDVDLEARTQVVKEAAVKTSTYSMIADGIANFELVGVVSKHGDSFSQSGSSVALRQAMRKGRLDDKVKAGRLLIESPGGAWAGTSELNAEVAAFAAVKPLIVAGDDLVASGGYLAATSATQIFLNAPGQVGSIGVYSTIADRSAAYEKAGVKIHLVKWGHEKGIGVEGVPITSEQLSVMQRRVDQIAAMFIEQVSVGRRVDRMKAEGWATGRLYSAAEGLKAGLIDAIGTPEEALAALSDRLKGKVSVPVVGTPAPSPSIVTPPDGVNPMTFKEIKAACAGIDPTQPADAAFLARLQEQDDLDAAKCTAAWTGELQQRLKAAEADMLAAKADAQAAKAAAAVSSQASGLAPGGNKAPGGEKPQGKSQDDSTVGKHPFEEAVAEYMQLHKVDQITASRVICLEQPELRKAFILAKNPGADRIHSSKHLA